MIKDKRKFKILLVIITIIIFQESIIYLSPINTINILSIIGLILLFTNIKNIINNKYSFKNLILSFVFIQIFGLILAKIFYGQSIILGLYGAHYIFIYGWYFYLVDIMRGNTNEYILFAKKTIIIIGVLIVSIVVIQGLLYDTIVFLNLKYAWRNGLRISGCYIATPVLIFLFTDIIEKYTNKKMMGVILVLFYLIKFNQSRSLIIILIVIFILTYLKNLKLNNWRFRFRDLFIASIGIVIIFITYNYWSSMLIQMFNEVKNIENTGGVRIEELKYYFSLLKEKYFLGIGILAYDFPLTEIIHGTSPYYYYLEDVGMFSMLFQTGIVGVIWLTLFLIKLNKVIKKHKNDSIGLLGTINYFRLIVGFLTIQIFNNKYALIYFLIVLAMLQVNVTYQSDNNGVRCNKIK